MECLFNWLNTNSTAIQAISAIFIVGLTTALSRYNKAMAKANEDMAKINRELLEENQKITYITKEQYKESRRSFLNVTFVALDKDEVYLLVEAIVETALKNIKIEFMPSLVSELGLNNDIFLIEEKIKDIQFLMPNKNILVYLAERVKFASLSNDFFNIKYSYSDCFGEVLEDSKRISARNEIMFSKKENLGLFTLESGNKEKILQQTTLHSILK